MLVATHMAEPAGTSLSDDARFEGTVMGRHSAPTVVRAPAERQEEPPTARHRSARAGRGVASWPVALVAVLILGVLGWLGWSWANSEVDSRASAQASSCTDGRSTVRVAAPSDATAATRAAAERWNAQRNVVHGHCVRIEVAAADSRAVLRGLTGTWNSGAMGPQPQAWISDNAAAVKTLSDTSPDLVGSKPESVGGTRSFVVLAGDNVSDVQIRAAQMFRSFLQRQGS